MNPAPVALWGAGAHARVVADILLAGKQTALFGFIDDVRPERREEFFCGAAILGGREVLSRLAKEGVSLIVAIGNCGARLACAARAEAEGVAFISAVSPAAYLAPDVLVEAGTAVMAGAVANAGARIGRHVILNSGAIVEHDCILEDGVHLSSGACLAGGVQVGRGAWIGIGAVVVDKVRIGAGSIVGAGAVLTGDIPEGVVAYGCPARVIRRVEVSHA